MSVVKHIYGDVCAPAARSRSEHPGAVGNGSEKPEATRICQEQPEHLKPVKRLSRAMILKTCFQIQSHDIRAGAFV